MYVGGKHGRYYLNFMGEKTEPSQTLGSSLLQCLEVVAACSKWLYFRFDHTVCAHGLAVHFLDNRTHSQQCHALRHSTMLHSNEPHLVP